jgi:hypothetical protein
MPAAIREWRVLSLTYVGAIEPQLFAPLALYVSNANRLMVDGYEINGKRTRWRELDIAAARDARQTAHTYSLESVPTSVRKTYPSGSTVLVTSAVRLGSD